MDSRRHAPEAAARLRADLEGLTGGVVGRLGIAVSGGPDSLALLLLSAAAWPGQVEAATVDHGLRSESTAEAEFVAALCRALGVPHAILRPQRPIEGNLQSEARQARYALLDEWRTARSLDWILTAHHADDQAETLLMRLNRGSGVAGLAGVRAVNGRVVRPLLAWRRAELAAIVAEAGIEAIADPSNADIRFDRARVRGEMAQASWLDPPAMARSASALADAEKAIEWSTEQLSGERITQDGEGLSLDPSDLPAELVRRLLLRSLRQLAPAAAPRGEELSRMAAALARGESATLAGIKATGGEIWRLAPAPSRRSG
jgi:tRNA(Ile)-lysidine synthase